MLVYEVLITIPKIVGDDLFHGNFLSIYFFTAKLHNEKPIAGDPPLEH